MKIPSIEHQCALNKQFKKKKKKYSSEDINKQVKLSDNLTVRVVKVNREYHYQCLQCDYHVRVSNPFNENHTHVIHHPLKSTNQLKITDFTKQDLTLSQQFQLNSALLSVVTRTSSYALTKPNAQDIKKKYTLIPRPK